MFANPMLCIFASSVILIICANTATASLSCSVKKIRSISEDPSSVDGESNKRQEKKLPRFKMVEKPGLEHFVNKKPTFPVFKSVVQGEIPDANDNEIYNDKSVYKNYPEYLYDGDDYDANGNNYESDRHDVVGSVHLTNEPVELTKVSRVYMQQIPLSPETNHDAATINEPFSEIYSSLPAIYPTYSVGVCGERIFRIDGERIIIQIPCPNYCYYYY